MVSYVVQFFPVIQTACSKYAPLLREYIELVCKRTEDMKTRNTYILFHTFSVLYSIFEELILVNATPVVNFINILRAAFMLSGPKSIKIQSSHQSF